MALKSLTTGKMVELTAALLKPGTPEHQAFTATPVGKAFLAQLQTAYDGLLQAQPPPNTAVAELTEKLAQLDAMHDRCVRALLHLIDGHIELADGEAERALSVLRDALFPTGAQVVQRSYTDEAGEAKLRQARIQPEHLRLLGRMKTLDGRTCEDVYQALQEAAADLGAGEAERVALGAAGEPVMKASAARGQWIRTITAIDAILVATNVDPATVLGPIREAEAAAERRRSRRGDPVST